MGAVHAAAAVLCHCPAAADTSLFHFYVVFFHAAGCWRRELGAASLLLLCNMLTGALHAAAAVLSCCVISCNMLTGALL
jgi:hypothetical protein